MTKNKTTFTYSVLERELRRDIISGKLKDSQRLRSETMLMRRYKISRNSVRKAIENLEHEGLVCRVKGSGMFVVPEREREEQKRIFAPLGLKERQILLLNFYTGISESAFLQSGTYDPTYNGIMRILENQGFNFLYSHVGNDITVPPCLLNGDVAGIIFRGAPPLSFWEKYMKKFPCVGIFTYHPEMKCNWVNLDDPARSFIAVHHLYKLGHRKIGFFTDTKDEPRTCDRFRGYLEALKYFGIRPNPDWNILFQRERIHGEYEMSPDPVPCRRELEIVFQKKNPPTSMILPSNWVLNGFRKEAETLGIHVPEDISLVGGCNTPSLRTSDVTCMNDRTDEVCAKAAQLLLDTISGYCPFGCQNILLRPFLLPGNTTAEPHYKKKEKKNEKSL